MFKTPLGMRGAAKTPFKRRVLTSHPMGKRHWHVLEDVFTGKANENIEFSRQSDRLSNASDKRDRREEKRRKNALLSFHYNAAHRHSNCFDSLNPFYIAK